MAESVPVAAAPVPEISPVEESEAPLTATEFESPPTAEVPAKPEESDAPQEEQAVETAPVESSESDESVAAKRKLDDLEQPRVEATEEKQEDSVISLDGEAPTAPNGKEAGVDGEGKGTESGTPVDSADLAAPAKRQRLDEEADGSAITAQEVKELDATSVGNGQFSSAETVQLISVESVDTLNDSATQEGKLLPEGQQLLQVEVSCKFEVPNTKVGVLIGKSGETIRSLQQNSGAKIQITRDAQSDPNSSTRPVELIGTPESVQKAEQLIKDVIKEAEAGGSPALVARGFGNASGSEQQEIQVPNEKVGMIIGKGGDTIKNLQTQSGARIQLIPQHLPEGDASTERTVRITGIKRQIEAAKNMIKEVMAQGPGRPSNLSGGFNQSRPRATSSLNQWGSRAPPPTQPVGYDYQQRGMYPPQSTQYHSQPYGSYAQQPPPRSNVNSSWEQRPAAPVQAGGYDHYAHGGQSADTQISNPSPAQAPGPVNYNYGQSQVASYGQPTPYTQTAAPQQNYGHGFSEQKYENQAPGQQYYGQPVNSQPGAYAQQGGTPQVDYAQQQAYNKPAYGNNQPSYGPPRANQPGDAATYQGTTPTAYGAAGPTQQPYPYSQNAPSQTAPGYGQPYGPSSGMADGYTQTSSAAGYPQQSGQAASGYIQQAPAYSQPSTQSTGYGQYPSSQPNYGDQPVANNANYGYQAGPADAGYGSNNVPTSGYGSAPVGNQAAYGQQGYVQPQSYPPGYEQQMQVQAGYGSQPAAAPAGAGYAKGLSPQPGYGGQYDTSQMYGQH